MIYPIVENGELLGAVDYDVLPNDAYIRIFLDMVAERSLNHDLDFEIDIEELFNKVNSGGNVKYRI